MLRYAVTPTSNHCITSSVRMLQYYVGQPFRMKTLSLAEIQDITNTHNKTDNNSEQYHIIDTIDKEIEEKNLSITKAVELMSYQDVQKNLISRNEPKFGNGKYLRNNLITILEKEEVSTILIF